MGWTIGMPSLKLNNVGMKSKHCGSFADVSAEALEERKGRDNDIDKELSQHNLYKGYRTSAELQEYSRKHIEELSAAQRAAGKRGVRSDAVVMCATIIKPPAAYMATLSLHDQVRFLRDAETKLDEIIGAENSKSSVIHIDEQGAHLHKFWEPITEDGRLCAKEVHNLKFFGRLNREMPEYLRSKGWDIDDCHAYDQAEEQLKSEQQKHEERRKRGRSSATYKAQAEADLNRAEERVEQLQDKLRDKGQQVHDLTCKVKDLQRQIDGKDQQLQSMDRKVNELEVMLGRQRKEAAENNIVIRNQRDAIAGMEERASELQEMIPDWPAYDQEATNAWNMLERLRQSMQDVFGRGWIFRNKKAEQGLLQAVEGCRDYIMGSIAAMRGFELRERVPEERQRSKTITRGLEQLIGDAERLKGPREPIEHKQSRELDTR